MATVGQQLTSPESGWKRYDDTDTNISYIGTFISGSTDSNWHSNTYHGTVNMSSYVAFNFTGAKFRVIATTNYDNSLPSKVDVEIDGTVIGSYSQLASSLAKEVLLYEVTDLSNKEHCVRILPNSSGENWALVWDVVDIDETGELLPYSLIVAPTNLVAAAGDSKVTLSWTAVEGATSYTVKRSTTSGGTYTTIASGVIDANYVDTSVTNGTTYYYVVTAVNADGESNNSNEASATPEGIALLRITMNDSSEREYRLTSTEIDAFVNWYTRTVGTGTTCYTFNDTIDKSKEYLAFEKIISFKVIPTVE